MPAQAIPPPPPPRYEAPWLSTMLHELGVKETPGPAATLRIQEYHSATAAGVPPTGDETSWCASFVSWALEQVNIRSTRSKSARSYEHWGAALPLDAPCRGAIAVLSRGLDLKSGHVGALLHWDASDVWLIGGNQGNTVAVARYPRHRVQAFRWPAGLPEAA